MVQIQNRENRVARNGARSDTSTGKEYPSIHANNTTFFFTLNQIVTFWKRTHSELVFYYVLISFEMFKVYVYNFFLMFQQKVL